jgi:multiple sugar transport system ATP-binding protein
MTVFKNLAFALKLRRVPRAQIERRVAEVAELLEIGHLLDRKPRELSGGQRQRVAVGRAIVRQPAAFLFDEPLSNLDAQLRVSTRTELKRLHRRLGTTTLYVTHDQEEAMTLGDRVVVLREGAVQQADPPMETYLHPANRFVASFIGTPPMNFFDGSVVASDGKGLAFVERLARRDSIEETPPNTSKTETLSTPDLTLKGQGFTLTLPPHLSEVLGGYVDRPVVLGIRPEHIRLQVVDSAAPVAGGAEVVRARVSVVEPLGRDMDVYMNTNLHDVVARVDAQRNADVRPDAWVDLVVDPSSVHVFEPGETGMNLSQKGRRVAAALTNEPAHAIA